MITPRLQTILNHISGKTLADIGTDHAYIPIRLAQNNCITKAFACDIKEGPLKIAENNIKKYRLEDIISTRLGAGLEPISPGEAETVVIAGMGGEMIINILSKDLEKSYSYPEIILQPMNFQRELRQWLSLNKFQVICEDLSQEGFKVYNLIKVKKGNGEKYHNELEIHLPTYLYNHPLFPMLYHKKKREFTKISEGLNSSKNKDYTQIEKYSALLKEMEKICF